MNILNYADFLQVARQQDQPQRLLFVFAAIELPDDASAEQRASFHTGQGGVVVPAVCVDKDPSELSDFASLYQEASQMGGSWQLLFASSLSGRSGLAPDHAAADAYLTRMVESIKQGQLQNMLVFDQHGESLQLQ